MEEKGDSLMAEGEKALKKRFLFFKSNNPEAAHEKFLQASTQYKVSGAFLKAALAYERAASISQQDENEHAMAFELEESAKMYIKANSIKSAVELYKRVVAIHEKNQSIIKAAKACTAIAELRQADEAMVWLQRAAKYYRNQGFKVMASDIFVKMADLKVQSGDYAAAQRIYEQQAREALEDRASRCNARYLFFNALLAQVAAMKGSSLMEDVEILKEKFETYQELETQFNERTREHMLTSAIITAIQSENPDQYDEAVQEYDSICPLSTVQKNLLLKGKQVLDSRVGDLR